MDPLVMCFNWFFTCLILPRDGLAYVLAKIVQASLDLCAWVMNDMIAGEREPRMALRKSWSWRIHSVYVGLGLVVSGRRDAG